MYSNDEVAAELTAFNQMLALQPWSEGSGGTRTDEA